MKKPFAVVAIFALAMSGLVISRVGTSGAAVPAPFSPLSAQQLAGYSTGTDVHAGVLQNGTSQLAHAEVAFSGASVASQGTNTRPAFGPGVGAVPGQIVNEMGQVVQPVLPNAVQTPPLKGDRSFGRGSALEVGLGTGIPNDGGLSNNGTPTGTSIVLPTERAQASAPPDQVPTTPPGAACQSTDTLCKNLLSTASIIKTPLLYADALENRAAARWDGNVNNCIVGAPYGEGSSHVARAQVLDLGTPNPDGTLGAPLLSTDAPQPNRAVGNTWSNERLVNQTQADGTPLPTTNGNLGLMSETRQTIAPVSLAWTPAVKNPVTGAVVIPAHPAVTIEVLGEWVLQAIAGGLHNSAYIKYGPDPATTTNSTPILRVTTYDSATGLPNPNPSQLTFQQVLGNTGLVVNVPPSPTTGPFLLQLHVAPAPHQIGDASGTLPPQVDVADGQFAAAAVDVLRVAALNIPGATPPVGAIQLADLRLGHMESLAQVASGGISCPLEVAKVSSVPTVKPGGTFTYTISVGNPFDCDLTSLHLVDTLTADPGVKYTVTSPVNGGPITVNSPSLSPTTITWDNLGSLPAHSPPIPVATITVQVDPTSGGGLFHDTVVATGPCAGRAANNLVALIGPPNTVNLTGTAHIDQPEVLAPVAPTTTTSTSTSTSTSTTSTSAPTTTTTTTAPTTTTTAPTTTTTLPPSQPANNTTTTTIGQPQVQAQTFTQAPPAVAVTATPSFTG